MGGTVVVVFHLPPYCCTSIFVVLFVHFSAQQSYVAPSDECVSEGLKAARWLAVGGGVLQRYKWCELKAKVTRNPPRQT